MIADFGFVGEADGKYRAPGSKGDELSNKTQVGTFIYMPPEMIEYKYYDSKKVDIWTAAIILFGMVSARHPWEMREADILNKNSE